MSTTNLMNALIVRFNLTMAEIADKSERLGIINDMINDHSLSLNHKLRIEYKVIDNEITKLRARAETLREVISELMEGVRENEQ